MSRLWFTVIMVLTTALAIVGCEVEVDDATRVTVPR
jgi:hypothetical protein